ncbi:glycoprotein beta-1,2-xylosyltransferase [Selaginella moellendorffii]|uniref:Glycoprotein beta-1,2-xylosyltransferase n=1 Tax=Selaginella moellendorffii TaxID=88036 RepID=D8R5W5_SELML|nr:beta-(1,2)-xylosyltransferase [Selaginella moellendorffii]EFJ32223.1 glycoprotein beta-1,2-xylosyltransferase [Selaginella moellendorffii]|eukprot:XP_024526763.1 beta-(1,2)-xylosyltransferase [Selaginella moellendorffii]
MRKDRVRRIVALVIVLNLIQLGYFFLHRSIEQQNPDRDEQLPPKARVHSYVVKKWSLVESYSPWLPADRSSSHSCEAFFGNGFSDLRRVVDHSGSYGGSFRCYHSDALKTSVCEGTKMVMHASRISMTAGGEEIDAVIGREEQEELPVFQVGAFELQVPDEADGKALVEGGRLDEVIARGHGGNRHGLRSLVESIRTVSSKSSRCSEVITKPTLFVTRFEYANLFHTVTDWYSSYASSRVVGLEERPMVVFLDGHCKSPMDDGWEAFFSGVKYAKHFGDNVCFDRAVFVPLGYETALFKFLGTGLACTGSSPAEVDASKTARLREFGEIFSAALSGSNSTEENRSDVIQVLLIRREDYLAHPRHSGKPESRLANEEELYKAMVDWASKRNSVAGARRKITVFNGLFAHMRLAEQIKAVKSSSIIVGVHGAGLTHIVFARPGTSVVEMLSPLFMRPHYMFISQWMGLDYHSIVMDDATVDCNQVLRHLDKVMAKLT